ncbi:MAG: hypothetical protein EOP36_18585 [Rubrivivax sp.]|nr:MAG: hypothetical protein EOP36_18585 [Rubrivivax sp.]
MKKARFGRNAAAMAAVASLMLLACSPALDWRTVRPTHSPDLQAVFPCKPTQLDRQVALPALPGPPVTLHLVSCKVGDATWALSYFDAQEIGRVSLGLAADNRALRDNLEALGRLGPPTADAGSLVTAQDLGPSKVAGMTPHGLSRHWRLVGRRPAEPGGHEPLEVHAWHFSHGLTVYQATLWRPIPPANAKDSTDAVETFIQGFKFSD